MRRGYQLLPGILASLLCVAPADGKTDGAQAVEFCLDGEFDLGVRLQGLRPAAGEFHDARLCIVTEDDSQRVRFSAEGHANPDMRDDFAVAYLPPDIVRLVNRRSPPDIDFTGSPVINETLRYRRIDPLRLVREIEENPDWIVAKRRNGDLDVRFPGSPGETNVRIADGRLQTLKTQADMPLRGRVPVTWQWRWQSEGEPALTLVVDGDVIFRGRAERRRLSDAASHDLWEASGGQAPREIPGGAWPARTAMQLQAVADGVYFVRGVRTGFNHLVVDTSEGLVVGDAPAGWVELLQIPPTDLVPGLGISGLSERFIDFLAEELPGRPLRAVALTHAHDDHAGGARAFAAAGADVYAPAAASAFLARALNREEMPPDRLSAGKGRVTPEPVSERVLLDDPSNRVELLSVGPGPHVQDSLGLWARDRGVFFQSDLLVPRSDAAEPRAGRATTECWFARWAVANLPMETLVLSSHSDIRTPVSRLAAYLESETCRTAGPPSQAGPRP